MRGVLLRATAFPSTVGKIAPDILLVGIHLGLNIHEVTVIKGRTSSSVERAMFVQLDLMFLQQVQQ